MTKKAILLAFLVFFYVQRAYSQCSSGSCYVPQSYYQNSGYYSGYSYPVYYSYPVVSSGTVYASAQNYTPSIQQATQSQLVPKKTQPTQVQPRKQQPPPPTLPPVLTGPNQIKVGELAVFKVEHATTKVAWIVVPQKTNFQEFENGQSAAFSSPIGGNFSFFAAVGSGNDLTILPHNLQVIDPNPGPSPPGPNPPYPPTPTDLKTATRLAISKVISQKKAGEAQFLAFSFLSVANLIKSGAITNSNQIIEVTKQSNQQALGSEKEKWKPFFDDMAVILNNMAKSGQLSTPEQHILAWNTIADALKETI